HLCCSPCPGRRGQRTFRLELLPGNRRHIREERVKSLDHRRVRENGVAEPRIWQICQHRRLHRGDDLAGLGANHREADNSVVITPTRAFMKPCFSSVVCARSTALIGSFAMRTVMPWRRASASLSPTRASGGSVNMQYGISRSRVLRFSPARLSLMILKSSADTWVNCGLPAHSPTAQTW